MLHRLYRYVGPADIRDLARDQPAGLPVRSPQELAAAVAHLPPPPWTYVVDAAGVLRVADRHSEHVACAGGGPVFAAGECSIGASGETDFVSNQSTGYCPDLPCWRAVVDAWVRAGLELAQDGFDAECTFRRCDACGARGIVKDDHFECAECGGPLPTHWNFDSVLARRGFAAIEGARLQVDVVRAAAEHDQDRAAVRVTDAALELALADGAGGVAHGTAAADAVVAAPIGGDPMAMVRTLESLDTRSPGQTTAMHVRVAHGVVEGVRAGDGAAFARVAGTWRRLGEDTPAIGTRRAAPSVFADGPIDALLLATDGLSRYVDAARLHAMFDADASELPWDLVDAARLPTGALRDDLTAILVRTLR